MTEMVPVKVISQSLLYEIRVSSSLNISALTRPKKAKKKRLNAVFMVSFFLLQVEVEFVTDIKLMQL